ncbi:MAG: hypothetical protein IPK19_29855 [Chloroflexi bacterium]|nr:hypothetical protein [Chloroflexota bacterium]
MQNTQQGWLEQHLQSPIRATQKLEYSNKYLSAFRLLLNYGQFVAAHTVANKLTYLPYRGRSLARLAITLRAQEREVEFAELMSTIENELAELETASTSPGESIEILTETAILYLALERPERAEDLLHKVQLAYSELHDSSVQTDEAYLALLVYAQKVDAAIEQINSADALARDWKLVAIVHALTTLRDHERAMQIIDLIVSDSPVAASCRIAESMLEEEQVDDAEEIYERAIELARNANTDDAWNHLIWSFYRTSRLASNNWVVEKPSSGIGHARALGLYASELLAKGMTDKAREMFDAANAIVQREKLRPMGTCAI